MSKKLFLSNGIALSINLYNPNNQSILATKTADISGTVATRIAVLIATVVNAILDIRLSKARYVQN